MADKRSFEEQVREQLADLNMQPEGEVWENVSSSLKEDKRRRWMVWMFLLAGSVSVATYGIYRSYEQPKELPVKTIVLQNKEKTNVNKASTIPQEVPQKSLTKQQVFTGVSKRSPVKHALSLSNEQPGFIKKENSNQAISNPEENSAGLPVAASVVPETGVNVVKQPFIITDSATAKGSSNEIQTPGSPLVPKSAGNVSPDSSSSPLTVSDKKNAITKEKHPWKLNALVDIGQIYLMTANFGRGYSLYAPSNSVPSNSALSSFPVTGFVYYDARPGFAYRLGLEAQKAITKKWDIGFSLAYQSLATRINVGHKVDSLLSFQTGGNGGYYIVGNDNVHTNQYHILQAGVSVYRHFNLGKKVSMRWKAGVEGNWLFSSNALYYDAARNVLYSDRELINKVQTSISTGFEFGIGKTPFLYVGPGTHYFVTTYDKASTVYDVRHLWNFEVDMHIPLSKNKKK